MKAKTGTNTTGAVYNGWYDAVYEPLGEVTEDTGTEDSNTEGSGTDDSGAEAASYSEKAQG